MAKFKGSGIVEMRQFVKEQGLKFETEFYNRLDPKARELFKKTVSLQWIDINDDPGDMQIVADMLFPGDPYAVRKVGKILSQRLFKGVYKIFLRIPTVPFIIKRIAGIWKANFDTGTISLNKVEKRKIILTIHGFPELTAVLLDNLAGAFEGILELAGVSHPSILTDMSDPDAVQISTEW